jgi:hypothetical protein
VTICPEASKAQKYLTAVSAFGRTAYVFFPPLEFFGQTFDGGRRAERSPSARFVQGGKALMPPAKVHRKFFGAPGINRRCAEFTPDRREAEREN